MHNIIIKSEKELMKLLEAISSESVQMAFEDSSYNEKYKQQFSKDEEMYGSLSEQEGEASLAVEEEEEEEVEDAEEKQPADNGEDASKETVVPSYENIKRAINILRAGHSLEDDDTAKNLKVYYESLTENERKILELFFEEVGKILNLTIKGDEAQDPGEPPVNINMTSAEEDADEEATAAVSSEEEDEEDEEEGEEGEDTSPPISVANEGSNKYKEQKFRQKIRELIRR